MGHQLRILVVEDLEDDFQLLVREVERAGYTVVAKQVETEAALIEALGAGTWDIVVADYSLPELTAEIALARVRDIVRDVKVFARAGDPDKRGPIDVRPVVKSALRMTWNEARHRAKLVEELGPVPVVDANDSRLGQAVLNVLVNAIQALPEGRAMYNKLIVRSATDDRGWARLEIEDTGAGIAPEHLPRVFEPFFTTKPAERAAGLGLSISKAIIAECGGTIDLVSEPGKGTVVTIALPPATRPRATRTSIPIVAGRRAKILVIDDEPGFGAVVERTLGAEHDIVATTSSRAALTAMERERPDVILCDLMMPDIDGVALYRMLDPDTRDRMVFITAGAFTPDGRKFLDEIPNPRLEKPFAPDDLRRMIRDLLAP